MRAVNAYRVVTFLFVFGPLGGLFALSYFGLGLIAFIAAAPLAVFFANYYYSLYRRARIGVDEVGGTPLPVASYGIALAGSVSSGIFIGRGDLHWLVIAGFVWLVAMFVLAIAFDDLNRLDGASRGA